MTDPALQESASPDATAADPSRAPRLLVVDGEPQRAQALAAALDRDWLVELTTGLEQALSACVRQPPDLALVDNGLADGSAIALIRRLHAQALAPAIPVIVITEAGDPLGPVHALEAGAADFIARPIHPRILQVRVSSQVMLRRQGELLRQWVYLDRLTGVGNRQGFDERLAAEWARAVRQGTELGVLQVEVDDFAAYTRHHGQTLGDDCLRRVGALLKSQLKRPGDLVARLSDSRFACLLPDTDLEGGLDLAHRVRLAMRGLAEAGTEPSRPTLSMGLATKPYDAIGSVNALLHESAAQLDAARAAGGNRYCGGAIDDPQ